MFNQLSLRRCFASRPKYFTLREIDKRWIGQRLDKLVMQKLDVSWSGAQKFVRSNKVFVANKRGAGGVLDEDGFVLSQIAYKIKDGDIMCIDDKLLDDLKEKSRKNKQKDRTLRKSTHAVESLSTEKFKKMIRELFKGSTLNRYLSMF